MKSMILASALAGALVAGAAFAQSGAPIKLANVARYCEALAAELAAFS